MTRTVVLNVVGLTPGMVKSVAPYLSALGRGRRPRADSTGVSGGDLHRAGRLPHRRLSQHPRDRRQRLVRPRRCEVRFWRQSNKLVQAPKIWERRAGARPDVHVRRAVFGGTTCIRPRTTRSRRGPMYRADGAKAAGRLHHAGSLWGSISRRELGTFPLFSFWGRRASIAPVGGSPTRPIRVDQKFNADADAGLPPHLDYGLQRLGPGIRRRPATSAQVDAGCGGLIVYFESRGARVIILSEYGIARRLDACSPEPRAARARSDDGPGGARHEVLDRGRERRVRRR